MTIGANLFDLPNELFLSIFQHVPSTDLIEAFYPIESSRLQALIRSFITHLDISQRTDQWIDTYLPDLLSKHLVIALRLEDRQLASISAHLQSTEVQSMHILNSDWSTDILKEALDRIRQQLKHLFITFTYAHGQGDLAGHLFQSDSTIEDLAVTGRFLYFQRNQLNVCTRLKSLAIELEDMHRLFLLLQHLPNLEELKVKLRSEERMFQSNSHLADPISCVHLRRVTFKGTTKHFDQLECFFTIFGSTIESLSIHIDLMYYTVDGQRLERSLLKNMSRLSSFDLIIHSNATCSDPMAIESFQSPVWQQFSPVVYWYDLRAHQQTIFTLPYRSDRFKYLSNESISSWISSRPVSLCFDSVRWLSLCSTTPLTLQTFQSIDKFFPNIQLLELANPTRVPGLEHDDHQYGRTSYMHEDLLCDNSLQLSLITKFSLLSSCHSDDYPTFRRLLHLLPNLVSLQMFIGRSLFRHVLAHEQEDGMMRNQLARIKLLQMVRFYDEKNVLSDDEIHVLFPNAVILFDYDDL